MTFGTHYFEWGPSIRCISLVLVGGGGGGFDPDTLVVGGCAAGQ